MQDNLTGANFAQHVDQTFNIIFDDHDPIPLRLAEVQMKQVLPMDARYGQSPEERRPPFSLLFKGPADLILPQRLYRFDHPAMGQFDIFIVPVGANAEAVSYEAIFT